MAWGRLWAGFGGFGVKVLEALEHKRRFTVPVPDLLPSEALMTEKSWGYRIPYLENPVLAAFWKLLCVCSAWTDGKVLFKGLFAGGGGGPCTKCGHDPTPGLVFATFRSSPGTTFRERLAVGLLLLVMVVAVVLVVAIVRIAVVSSCLSRVCRRSSSSGSITSMQRTDLPRP